jgi:predicted phage tail protein
MGFNSEFKGLNYHTLQQTTSRRKENLSNKKNTITKNQSVILEAPRMHSAKAALIGAK